MLDKCHALRHITHNIMPGVITLLVDMDNSANMKMKSNIMTKMKITLNFNC